MKKTFLLLLIVIASFGNVSAQELTKNLFNVYYGQPKTLTQQSGGITMQVEFDRRGRVLCKKMGDMKFKYRWDDEIDEVEVTLMNGDIKLNSTYLYIDTFSPTHYVYETDGVQFEVFLKENGAIQRIEQSNGQMTVIQEYFYENEDDVIPLKITGSNGTIEQTIYIGDVKVDEWGNMIKATQASNGMINTISYEIEYY